LGDESARLPQRNRALKWVVHLVGDIHQPLHAANRRDRGGNTVQVSFFRQRDNPPYGSLNLHAVWDVHMVRRLAAGRGGERAFVSASLSERDKAAWEKGSISGWVAESHAIAGDFAYAALPAAASCRRKITGVVALGEAYYDQAAPVIEVQIRKAGVRLAKVLNEALGR
ncbi:MAG TPA: S1/P1 nuclease, partial [Burkholderiales bacterium]|nr:S1/P1 nuclease [Burkholderiales bacterium]